MERLFYILEIKFYCISSAIQPIPHEHDVPAPPMMCHLSDSGYPEIQGSDAEY